MSLVVRGFARAAVGAGFLIIGSMISGSAAAEELPPAQPVDVPVHRLLQDPARLSARLDALNPDVGAARARIRQAQAQAAGSRLYPNPVVDASLSAIPLSSHRNSPRFSDNSVWNVGVSETLELGKRSLRAEAADLHARSARLDLDGTLAERMAAARAAMADALHLALRTATLEGSLKDAERATELERVRYEQKALSGMDYDRMLLELTTLESEVARSRAEFAAALGSCSALLAGPCDLNGAVEQDLDSALPLDGLRASDRNLSRRADLAALLVESAAAKREAALARRRAIPDPTFRVAYTRDNSADPGEALDSLSVGVTLPLPLSDRGQHDAERALARASELEQQRRGVFIGARADLDGLLRRKGALEQTLAVLERDSLPRAKSVLDSTQQAFDHGGIALTDLLLARRSYVGLRLTLLDQRFELFTIRNDLYRVLGLDTPTRE